MSFCGAQYSLSRQTDSCAVRSERPGGPGQVPCGLCCRSGCPLVQPEESPRGALSRAAFQAQEQGAAISESRRVKNPKRSPGFRYKPESYGHAVERAAEKAKVPHWHPNQLRLLFATEVRRSYGLEAAQVLLGHSRADVT